MHNPQKRLRRGLGGTNFGSPDGVAGAAPLQKTHECKHRYLVYATSLTQHPNPPHHP